MLPELLNYAIILALCLAVTQAVVPLIGAVKQNVPCMRLARFTAIGQFLLVGFAFFGLGYCFLVNDFTVQYVAQNSNTNLPWMYRFCAIWGAHEGSLLLWVFILSVWTAAVSIFSKTLPMDMRARVLAVMGWVSIGFYVFLLTASNPFTRYLPNYPVNGASLNPILQDPGLAIHPPMLYMGYVGFSVAFAFAIAALISGRLDAAWARWSRPWTLVAWCFLTYGIVLGSWWAYRELGWGGWWFWDPVENAAFLPWLVGTALIHSLAVTEKRNVFKAWTVLLAVCAFSLSLLGTFLVRSGILISVHAFAIDPERGMYMLRFLMIVVGGSLALYAWRAGKIVNTGKFHFWSRETMLLCNNIILFVAMVTVLLGTLYPLVVNAMGLGRISVGAPYFNAVFVPLMIPLLFLMGVGPFFHWNQMDPKKILKQLIITFVLVCVAAIALPMAVGVKLHFSVILGLALAFWVIGNMSMQVKRATVKQWAMILAHVGMGVTVIGIVLTTVYSQQENLSMKPGDKVGVGPYQFQFVSVAPLQGPDFSGVRATLKIDQDGQPVGVLHPEIREFPVQKMQTSKTAINVGIFRDLYVALGSNLSGGAWAVRIYYKPFIRWMWGGGLLMVLGGIIALWDKRYRRVEKDTL